MTPFKRLKLESPTGSNAPVWLLMGWLVASAVRATAAQGGVDLSMEIDAGTRARTETLSLTPLDEFTVELVDRIGEREPILSIYIHDDQGVLVGRDDPESISDRFSWQPQATGKYYAVVENTGPGGAIVRVRTATGTRAVHSAGRTSPAGFATVRVFFATDRQDGGTSSEPLFGSTPAPELSYGYGDVSIPRDHRLGELEGPSILRLEFRANPSRHIVLLQVQSHSERTFREQISARIATSRRKEVLLFVHGFNVAFDDAMRRTAQVAYDLAFDGPAVTFSWPSQGSASPLAYTRDQRNADLSASSLKKVLELLTSAGDVTVHVIAHSMGNRVLAGALQQLAPAPAARLPGGLREIAFVAPDVDAELFKRIVKQVAGKAARMTLYASSRDGALAVAQRVAGYQRAGQAGAEILVVPEVQTIDASEVDTSLLGLNHSYFADNSTIVSDLFTLLKGQPPQERFGLMPIATAAGTYWRFRPAIR
jgi:esterase/lipase superfamily enzyme